MSEKVGELYDYQLHFDALGHPELVLWVEQAIDAYTKCQQRAPLGPLEVVYHMYGKLGQSTTGCQECQQAVRDLRGRYLRSYMSMKTLSS